MAIDATDPELTVRTRSLQALRMLELLAGETNLAPEVNASWPTGVTRHASLTHELHRMVRSATTSQLSNHHGAVAIVAADSEAASWSVSSRAIGRSSAEWYGASPSSTSGRADAATPTLPSGTSMASKC